LLATPQAFAYDLVGNRTTNASLYNVGNQLTEDASFTYTYDLNGNLTRKTLLATGNYTQFTYDAENRLVKVDEFAAGSSTPGATSTYRYDGLGRRIEKVGNGITRRYVYDAEDILLEYDGANVLQARYIHGPGIDEPIAMARGGANYFYHQDGLGTVTELTDSGGGVAKSYAYDAYGNILDQTGTVENPYTYTGREFDAETGLYYYRARYYDPRSGRFLRKDPIGFDGGDVNLYNYVLNSPTNKKDPVGLTAQYNNPTSAARSIIRRNNPLSIQKNLEYCGMICKDCTGQYFATGPVTGSVSGCIPGRAPCCPVRVSARPVGCLSCMSFALLALLSCLSSRASVAFLSQCPSPLSRFSAVRR
jgi:RHS repeat-associated protein